MEKLGNEMSCKINFYETANEDIFKWKKCGQKTITEKITESLKDISEHPYYGICSP